MPKLCFSFFFLIMLHLLLASELSFGFPNCNKIVGDTLSKNSRKSASFTLYIRNKLTQLHYVSSLMKLSSKWDLFSALCNSSSNFGKLCPLMLCNCFTEICCHAVLPLRNICPTLSHWPIVFSGHLFLYSIILGSLLQFCCLFQDVNLIGFTVWNKNMSIWCCSYCCRSL